MVLNFCQLQNYMDLTFQMINSENPKDNYTVGPRVTTVTQDMWLAQGDGKRGVSIFAFGNGSPIRNVLYMWDENWKLCYRVGGESKTHSIGVDGNKDFFVEVNDKDLAFVCKDGTFDGKQARVVVHDWNGATTDAF